MFLISAFLQSGGGEVTKRIALSGIRNYPALQTKNQMDLIKTTRQILIINNLSIIIIDIDTRPPYLIYHAQLAQDHD